VEELVKNCDFWLEIIQWKIVFIVATPESKKFNC